MKRATTTSLQRRADRVTSLSSHLEALSPQRTLERGFTVTRMEGSGVVRSAAELQATTRIVTRFADGEVTSVVDRAENVTP